MVIVALSISALVGVFIVLVGSFGTIEGKILMTSLALSVSSLFGMSSGALWDKKKSPTGALGILSAIVLFIMNTYLIWVPDGYVHFDFKIIITQWIITFALTHISLVLLPKVPSKKVLLIQEITIILIAIAAGMLIIMIFTYAQPGYEGNEAFWSMYFRVLGAMLIFNLLGTLTTPLLTKVLTPKNFTALT